MGTQTARKNVVEVDVEQFLTERFEDKKLVIDKSLEDEDGVEVYGFHRMIVLVKVQGEEVRFLPIYQKICSTSLMSEMNVNAISKIAYSGANQSVLENARRNKNFYSREWVTFIQARKIGKKIAKGEEGVKLVRVLEIKKKGKKENKTVVRSFTVFNTLQTEEVKNA